MSTTSPTPYWSSNSRKIPERKSLTRVWEPKPSATPTMPALAMMGPMFRPISLSIIVTTMATMMPEVMLLSSVPSVLARWTRRVEPGGGFSGARPNVAWEIRSGRTPSSALLTILSINRCRMNCTIRPTTTRVIRAPALRASRFPRLVHCSWSMTASTADMRTSILKP